MEKEILIEVTGMHCVSCASLIETSLKDLSGVKKANVDYSSAKASVIFNDEQVSTDNLLQAIKDAGYGAKI